MGIPGSNSVNNKVKIRVGGKEELEKMLSRDALHNYRHVPRECYPTETLVLAYPCNSFKRSRNLLSRLGALSVNLSCLGAYLPQAGASILGFPNSFTDAFTQFCIHC
jgi:hypothetical protein